LQAPGLRQVQAHLAARRGCSIEPAVKPSIHPTNPRVDAIRSSLAIAYGPLVYCFEGADQPAGVNLSDMRIRSSTPLKVIWREDLLGKIMEIKAQGAVEDMSIWEGTLYRALSSVSPLYQDLELTAVPYYAWANRGPGTMRSGFLVYDDHLLVDM